MMKMMAMPRVGMTTMAIMCWNDAHDDHDDDEGDDSDDDGDDERRSLG